MRDSRRPSTPRRNTRPGGPPPPSARKGTSASSAAGGGCLLVVAFAATAVGLLLVLTQLYPTAWADNTVGPLMAATLLPVYAFATYAMTPNRRRP